MPPLSTLPRAGYLGPEGTFSEEALLGSIDGDAVTPTALETIRDAIMAVQNRAVEWSLVPIENSIEGSVTITLDTLAGEAGEVEIVGEVVLPVRHNLIATHALRLEQIETIVSHPHVPGQCARFLRERVPHARITAASSTAEAVRLVAERAGGKSERPLAAEHQLAGKHRPALEQTPASEHKLAGEADDDDDARQWAAIGTRLAAELYGCVLIARGIQDREDNETRFVWLAHTGSAGDGPPLQVPAGPARKTSLVFWGAGADHAGWLVLCLDEFARRTINLTKIESRPMRERLGHYMFFVDLQGSLTEERVAQAISGLRAICEQVRVLGSYPVA
jgi:prephenate dehydratase